MCGIAGIYSGSPRIENIKRYSIIVRKMTDRMVHRGPDASGIYSDNIGCCTLGHRRLSIIDTSDAGRQPMHWNKGEWTISFNGEIYNFQELKSELQAKGIVFQGRTDTEVLLAGLVVWGEHILERLDGMFAFAAYHQPTKNLILARDPFGEKPLYYLKTQDGVFAFASELQCLEIIPGFSAEVCPDAMSELLMFQYIGAPRTIYRNVHKLSPGHYMKINGNNVTIKRYFKFEPGVHDQFSASREYLVDQLEDILVRSLKRRLISDVPLGAFLSGGVDSSTVCALVRHKLNIPLQTFSIGFAGDTESEHLIARQLAKHLGTEHRDQIVTPSSMEFLVEAGSFLDEPNADSSCMPTYLLSGFARKHVTVALSGDGGDELFGGYSRYFQTLKNHEEQRNGDIGWSAGKSYYYSNRILVFSPEQLAQLFGFIPTASAEHVKRLISEVDINRWGLLNRLRATDVENYLPGAVLPKVDRMSMQHSLEVRTPFLNVELARFAERLPIEYLGNSGRGKLLLREVAYRYLPREIIDLPKKGFGLPLNSDWGKLQLVSALRESLGDDTLLGNWLGSKRVKHFVDTQSSENGFSIYQTWSVVMLSNWLRNRPAVLPDSQSFSVIPKSGVSKFFSANQGIRQRLVFFVAPSVIVVTHPMIKNYDDTEELNGLSIPDLARLYFILKSISIDLNIEELKKWSNASWVDAEVDIDQALALAQVDISACCVISLDFNNYWVTINAIQKLRLNNLRELIIPARFMKEENWIKYEFNRFNIFERIINLIRLFPYALAVWIQNPITSEQETECKFKHLSQLTIETDTENVFNYVFLNSFSQYLPFISSHKEISKNDVGRYSIWNQGVYYSQQRIKRAWYLKPFFFFNLVAPINNNTKRFLSVTSQLLKRKIETNLEGSIKSLVQLTNQNKPENKNQESFVVYTQNLSAGGAERQWCNLAIGLKELGKNVYMVVDNLDGANGHYLYLVRAANINILQLTQESKFIKSCLNPDLFSLFFHPKVKSSFFLAVLLKRLNPYALITQLDATNINGAIAALLSDIPKIVMSFRNYNPTHFDYLKEPHFLYAYQNLVKSHRVTLTGNSKAGNFDYAKWIGIEPNQISLLHNSYLPDVVNSLNTYEILDVKRSFGISSETKVILGAFRLTQEKNPLLFIDVCADVLEAVPNVTVLLCGEGLMYEELQKRVRERNIQDRFHFLGRVSQIWRIISISDVLLLTSNFEGTPNIVREALMLNCPVVSTICGGIPDMIEEGITGYLVPTGDRKGIVARLKKLLESDEIRKNMIKSIKSRPLMKFGPKEMAANLIKIIEEKDSRIL
ncbi:asparagine synthase (glutamine-hydrolyzing) [Ferrovum sp. PN-J185]|uniref:asparagine synthase (glutamine-hydrolyzing) n=1 Tax=Ferrovum sp. PN-J185 TaxID=1356306 RepID=UPI000792F7B3|nr:asparagine synthase (glutamine-hydrolyzing) [Ferrovum sp. PN-J185]KXW55833.1 asparagine synthetase [glutamine-hydrolyzing] 1 [Ferrovum sp. PN-J185]